MERQTLAGRYELQERVGSGWRARDLELERDVLVRPADETTAAAALLDHPNIARVFDQGEADGERFVVLEYLPGGPLDERLTELDERGAYAVAAGIADALAHAHGRGVAHGSLSERSVLLDGEGRAKVTGFTAAGAPADDVAAFGRILDRLASPAPGLAPVAAAAAAGADSATLAAQLGAAAPAPEVDVEEPTLIQRPARAPRRRLAALLLAAALLLVAGGIGAAVLLTSDDSPSAGTTPSFSVPLPSETTTAETEPATTTPATTTETVPTTTAPETVVPPPTEATIPTETEPTPPPPPTTEELPTTEPPPATEPPPTTEPVTTTSATP